MPPTLSSLSALARFAPTLAAWVVLGGLLPPAVAQPSANDTFQRAVQLYQAADWPAAAAKFELLLKQPQGVVKSHAARYFAAECQTQLGNAQAALDRYEALLADQPPEVYCTRAHFRAGEAAHRLHQPRTASAHLRKFLAAAHLQSESTDWPDHWRPFAWWYLGEIATADQQWTAAAEAYGKLVERFPYDPHVPNAQLKLAEALLALGQPTVALTAAQRAAEQFAAGGLASAASQHAAALLTISRIHYTAGDYELAIATARELVSRFAHTDTNRSEPHDAARLVAGWAMWKLERYNEIKPWLKPLTKIGPKQTERLAPQVRSQLPVLLGMTAYAGSEWATAWQELSRAAQLDPQRANLTFYAGESARRASELPAARHWLNRTLEIESSVPVAQQTWSDDALWSLAQLASAVGDLAEAKSRIVQLRRDYPGSRYAGTQLATLATRRAQLLVEAVSLERDGRWGAALAVFEELQQESSQVADHSGDHASAEALFRHARLLQRGGQRKAAQRLYKQLVTLAPTHRRAAQAHLTLARMADDYLGSGEVATIDTPAAVAKRYRAVHAQHPETPESMEAACWLAQRAIDGRRYSESREWLSEVLTADQVATAGQQARAKYLLLQIEVAEQHWSAVRATAEDLRNSPAAESLQLLGEFWLAESEFRLGNSEQAHEAYKALSLRTEQLGKSWTAMVPLRLAQMAARRQQWLEVLETLANFDQRYPSFPLQHEAIYLLGRAHAGRGQMRLARSRYQQVLVQLTARGSETAAMAQWMIGETYFHQENYHAAREAYLQVQEHRDYPDWTARAALQAGKCCELLGEWEQANEQYAQGLETASEPDASTQLQARLQWTQQRIAGRKPTAGRK